MKSITILSLHSNRPDFIKPQLDSAKKYLKDGFKYIVVNNAYYSETDKPKEIEQMAQEERTGYVRVNHKGLKPDISHLVADTLNYLWSVFNKTKGVLVIMDCDLFFINDISINLILEGYDMAFCPIYTHGKVWPWTGLMIFDMDKLKVDKIDFSHAPLSGGFYSDVGSALFYYIQTYYPKIRFLDRKDILNDEWILKGKETTHTLGFPKPYSIDVVSMVQYPFLFHYKTSSNYAKHCTKKYNVQKTKALKKLCELS